MRCTSLLVAVIAWWGTARAEPDPPPPSAAPQAVCKVTIISAPERIRLEINQWVEAEHRCSRTLELRVEPGEGGALMVYARDDKGHVRQRQVPDDQSIGALIVSWIADDAPAPPPPPPPVAPPVAAPAPPPRPPPPAYLTPRPSEVPLLAPEAELAAVTSAPATPQWWMLSGAISVSELRKFGVRAERDLASAGPVVLDVSLSQLENSRDSLSVSMTTATAFGALEVQRGGWQFRGQLGVGLRMFWIRNYCDCELMGIATRDTEYKLRPVTEVEALVGHALGERWSIAAGALLTIGTLGFDAPYQDRVSAMMIAGIRSRL